MRLAHQTLAAFALLALAAGARAGDVVLGGKTELWYDDNVYGLSSGEIGDGSLNVAPTIELTEDWGSVDGELFFKPTYELFFQEDELRGFNYDASGRLNWRPSPTTSVWVEDTYARYRNVRNYIPGPGQGAQPFQVAGRDRFSRNIARFGVRQRTSPKGQLDLLGIYSLWDFSREFRPHQDMYYGALQYSHTLARAVSLGGSVSFSRQAFDYEIARDSHTDYYNGSLSISYVPAETFTLRASAGPTLVRAPGAPTTPPSFIRADLIRVNSNGEPMVGIPGSCPVLPSGDPFDGPGCQFVTFPLPGFLRLGDPIPLIGPLPDSERNTWTYFADVALEREWDTASVQFSYRRDQGSSSAIGFSTVADIVELRGSYDVWRELTLRASFAWENREQAVPGGARQQLVTVLGTLPATPTQPAINNLVPVAVQTAFVRIPKQGARSLIGSAGASYRINKRTTASATFFWSDQDATEFSGFGDYDRILAIIGLTIELEPFRW